MKQFQRKHSVKILTTILVFATGLCSVSLTADEIFKWTDENGVVHFGDRPPEGHQAQTINVPEFEPAETSVSPPSPEDQEIPASDLNENTIPAEEEAVPLTAAQLRREKMANDRKERQEAKAEIDTMCQKHRQRVEQIEPYRRVFYTNEQGESVRMDDELRIELVAESKSYVAENCD
jgi:hypothetical protein